MSDSFATPWTVAHQAPLPMRFTRQEYWRGLPLLSPGDLPNPRIKSPSPALAGKFILPLSHWENLYSRVQFSLVTQSCLTLWDPMNHSTPGLPVHHRLLEFTQTHVHRVGDSIQPSYPLSSPSRPAPNPSQHQGLFQWVNSSHEVASILEFQLRH